MMIAQSSDIPFDQLLGPYGLLVFLLLMFWIVGRLALKFISDIQKDRDFWKDKSIELLETAASAVNSAVRLAPEDNIVEMARKVERARREGRLP